MSERESLTNEQAEIGAPCRLLARSIAVVAALGVIVCGVWTCITITGKCLAAGIIMISLGLMVLLIEAPACCMFLDGVGGFSRFMDRRGFWVRGVIYGILSVIPVILCISIASLIGCALTFAAGVFYGMLSIGRRGDAAKQTKSSSSVEMNKLVEESRK